MSSAGDAASALMSIGEVLARLRQEFPDITISKIRYLESEGLIRPLRTASSYRKFSHDDLTRLHYILAQQRDHYLPLKVIREHLDALDRGLEITDESSGRPRVPRAMLAAHGMPTAEAFADDHQPEVRLSRDDVLRESGLADAALTQLEQFGLITAVGPNQHYDADALLVASTVAEMGEYGIEPRHLRSYRAAADREIGLFEQVVTPLMRQRGSGAQARADEVAQELAALSVRLHATLVRIGLRRELGR